MIKKIILITLLWVPIQSVGGLSAANMETRVDLLTKGFGALVKKQGEMEEEMVKIQGNIERLMVEIDGQLMDLTNTPKETLVIVEDPVVVSAPKVKKRKNKAKKK